jgi:hypothetical protein
MIYGDEKRLEMARSILPSTSAGTFKKRKKWVKKANRAEVRNALRVTQLDEDNEPSDKVDINGYPDHEIRYLVGERRGADKVGPFMRWAVEVTRDIPVESRLSYVRGLLPKNLIGEHAVGHVAFLEEFRFGEHNSWFSNYTPETPSEVEARRSAEAAARIETLKEICRSGWGLGALNAALMNGHVHHEWVMGWEGYKVQETSFSGKVRTVRKFRPAKSKKVGPAKPRLLKNIPDILPFLEDLSTAACRPHNIRVEPYNVPSCPLYWRKFDDVHNGTVNETRYTTRVNPEWHGEWYRTMREFVDRWVTGKVERPYHRRRR